MEVSWWYPCKQLISYTFKGHGGKFCKSPKSANYQIAPAIVTESCWASLTCILDIIIHLQYKTLYVLGVDLDTSEHFYSAVPWYVQRYSMPGFEKAVKEFNKEDNRGATTHAVAARGLQFFLEGIPVYYAS